jgi:diguanylate cyclase (GGDEF)-like protein
VAGLTSGDQPANSRTGAIEGHQESITPPSGALEDEQTLADREQTLADSDATLADEDQTGSESDQTSADKDQLAADRDQAASDRDLAAGVNPAVYEFSHNVRERTTRQRGETARQREETAQARLDAAQERDAIAHIRDLAALARDHAANSRDLAMAQRDVAHAQDLQARSLSGAEIVMRAAEQRRRAAVHRVHAAEQRALADEDRRAAARDREKAARERLRAREDREALARQLAIAALDPLTGARTRAAGLSELDHELDRCRRTSGLLVVAYVDVVGLKTLNDSMGHAAGDELLRCIAALIKEHLRSYDLIIRLGGDEFLCAMSDMTLPGARQRFSAIAAALASTPGPGAIRTGFAELTPDQTATELIVHADIDLINTRRAGDNGRPTADTANVTPIR